MSDAELYIEREQTLVKHFILRKYLEGFAPHGGVVCRLHHLHRLLFRPVERALARVKG